MCTAERSASSAPASGLAVDETVGHAPVFDALPRAVEDPLHGDSSHAITKGAATAGSGAVVTRSCVETWHEQTEQTVPETLCRLDHAGTETAKR